MVEQVAEAREVSFDEVDPVAELRQQFSDLLQTEGKQFRPALKQIILSGGFEQYVHWRLDFFYRDGENYLGGGRMLAYDPIGDSDIFIYFFGPELKKVVLKSQFSYNNATLTDDDVKLLEYLIQGRVEPIEGID